MFVAGEGWEVLLLLLFLVEEDELKCRAIWFKRGDEILWEVRASVGEERMQIIGLMSQVDDARIN